MSRGLQSDEDVRQFALNVKLDIHNNREHAATLLWCVLGHTPGRYLDLDACKVALKDESLLDALKEAHASGSYDTIRTWNGAAGSSPVTSPNRPSAGLRGKDARIRGNVDAFLNKLRPNMRELVAGRLGLPLWSPPLDLCDEPIRQHLRGLRIPSINDHPNLLLHGLGTFSDIPALDRRLDNIFLANTHTFLVNTSGSGKTRILLEGLCKHWGFYFTSTMDPSKLGSSDVKWSIDRHVPKTRGFEAELPPSTRGGFKSALAKNQEIAHRVFQRVFLARLLIFTLFLETMQQHLQDADDLMDEALTWQPQSYATNMSDFKYRWLILQLQPSLLDPETWDIFDHLSSMLLDASTDYITSTTESLLNDFRSFIPPDTLSSPPLPVPLNHSMSFSTTPSASYPPSPTFSTLSFSTSTQQTYETQSTITNATSLLPPVSSTSSSPTTRTPLFCVLDEAQYAATLHTSAFRASTDPTSPRPILREIIKAWDTLTYKHGTFFVVAGTGISKDVVDRAVSSAVAKVSEYRWCSDTGAFDTKESIEQYLAQFVPPGWMESRTGRRVGERVWYWLQGRYRFAAGYVSYLIANGFQQPHRLLDAYVKYFTNFHVTDARRHTEDEPADPIPPFVITTMDFSKLAKHDLVNTIHRLTFHHITRGNSITELGSDGTQLVELGFARFSDTKTKFKVMDEPLVILAAANWLNHHTGSGSGTSQGLSNGTTNATKKNAKTHYRLVAHEIGLHQSSAKFNGLENYLAVVLDLVLSSGTSGGGRAGIAPPGGRIKVNELFTFCGPAESYPAWSHLTAELVAIHRVSSTSSSSPSSSTSYSLPPSLSSEIEQNTCARSHNPASGSSVSLGKTCTSPTQTLSWLSHLQPGTPPICFPDNAMGPDLLFVLRLSDGTLLWVALQVKLVESQRILAKESLRKAIRSVTPMCFYLKRDGTPANSTSIPNLIPETHRLLSSLPQPPSTASRNPSGSRATLTSSPPNPCRHALGKYTLLRAIAVFPALPALERCIDTTDGDPEVAAEIPEAERHPIAVLNMELVKQITRHLSPTGVLENKERFGANGSLVGGGAVGVTTRKRKRSLVPLVPKTASAKGPSKKKKKINLNS